LNQPIAVSGASSQARRQLAERAVEVAGGAQRAAQVGMQQRIVGHRASAARNAAKPSAAWPARVGGCRAGAALPDASGAAASASLQQLLGDDGLAIADRRAAPCRRCTTGRWQAVPWRGSSEGRAASTAGHRKDLAGKKASRDVNPRKPTRARLPGRSR
jgi:hypothetical protein